MQTENMMQDDLVLDGDLPEPGTVQIVFDSLNDTLADVAGTEGLTPAQCYMEGVLSASGVLTSADRVNGSESFFSKVGAATKATLEYIKNMFKKIWEFFFKKTGPEQAKSIKTQVSETKAKLDDKEVLKIGLEKVVPEELKKELTEVVSESELNEITKKIIAKNETARKAVATRISTLSDSLENEIKVAGQIKAEAVKGQDGVYQTFASGVMASSKAAEELNKKVKGAVDIKSPADAKAILTEMETALTQMAKTMVDLGGTESRVKSEIADLEKVFSDSGKGITPEEAHKLKALNAMMKAASAYSGAINRVLQTMTPAKTAIARVFGI